MQSCQTNSPCLSNLNEILTAYKYFLTNKKYLNFLSYGNFIKVVPIHINMILYKKAVTAQA